MYGIDTISAGATISFAMECFERGYLSKADCDGLEPTFGNAEALLTLIERIGERQGIGDLLSEGSKRAAAKIGGGAEELSIQVKGLELGMHEPRLKAGLGLGYAVANTGGDHCVGMQDTSYSSENTNFVFEAMPLGVLEPMPAEELSTRKVAFFRQRHRWYGFADSACYCFFVP
jgi:aldehyde:ferredoxin oxidoreductase